MMARIRSVHPGLWTDERFASVSPLARLLFIGIWTECDDAGSFEWSPIKLKMRILPADSADAAELLEELASVGAIMGYEIEGRKLGAVRNFTKYQRPKKPNSTYPQTDQVRKWCGDNTPSVGNRFGTGGENLPQMEDGGGNSVSNETAQSASDAEFWSNAKSYLSSESRNPGALIGKWCKEYTKPIAAQAITSAQIERPATKVPYIEAILRKQHSHQPAVPL